MDISENMKIDKKINKHIDNQVCRYLLSEVTLCNVTITLFKNIKLLNHLAAMTLKHRCNTFFFIFGSLVPS